MINFSYFSYLLSDLEYKNNKNQIITPTTMLTQEPFPFPLCDFSNVKLRRPTALTGSSYSLIKS